MKHEYIESKKLTTRICRSVLHVSRFMFRRNTSRGFTLVEALVGTAVFIVVATVGYGAFAGLFKFVNLAQYRELAVNLGEEQMEIIRNMPYEDVGVEGSIPDGNVPYQQTVVRGGVTFAVTAIIRNIDLPFDGLAGGTPNDTNPADNKLVSLTIECDTCVDTPPFIVTGHVAPLSLESSGNTGSLFIHVYDATGVPIQGASVTTINDKGTTTITINDVTNSAGTLALVGVPPGVNAYHVTATKSGYSTDRTYYPNPGNPDPSNPDATVVTAQVSNVNLFIDQLASLAISSVSPTCTAVPNYDFNLTGSKQIGTDLFKYSDDLSTGGSGTLNLPNTEWDTGYMITPIDTAYDLAGVNPPNPIALNPGADVNLQLTVVPKDPQTLLVSVTDGATGLPLSGASVRLYDGVYDETEITGQGFINQTDWSGGSGQESYVGPTQYWNDDSNVDVTTVPGDIRLRNAFGEYNPSGFLESSTFDTGTSSNFYNFVWEPTNQPASTSAKLQFAVSPSSPPSLGWSFAGPDGTSGSYYTVSNSSFDAGVNGNRYARYRVYLETATSTATADVSDVGFSYTSDCIPPGQVIFQGLSAGTYNLSISKSGYTTVDDTVSVDSDWQEKGAVLNE